MTTEQLMIPRIKCAIRYPCSPFPVGAILEQDFEEREMYNYTDSNGRSWLLESPGLYPEVFEPLPWWKDRKVEDLPEYIMFANDYAGFKNGQVFKTENWNKQNEAAGYCIGFITGTGEYDKCAVPISCGLLPATKEEYEAYIKWEDGSNG